MIKVMTIESHVWNARKVTAELVRLGRLDGPVKGLVSEERNENSFVISVPDNTPKEDTDRLYWYLLGAFNGMQAWEIR